MEKGVTKSLEDKAQQYVENQVRKSIDQIISKPTVALDEVLNNQNPKQTINSETLSDYKTSIQNETSSGSKVHNMIWIYTGLQILLGYLGYKTPEILLISLVSVFVGNRCMDAKKHTQTIQLDSEIIVGISNVNIYPFGHEMV